MSDEKRLIPIQAQCSVGAEVISRALADGRVMAEQKEAAAAVVKTLDWLLANHATVKLAAQIARPENADVMDAIKTVMAAKKHYPAATLYVREEREPGEDG